MAEAEDLKSSQCGFDPHSGHYRQRWAGQRNNLTYSEQTSLGKDLCVPVVLRPNHDYFFPKRLFTTI